MVVAAFRLILVVVVVVEDFQEEGVFQVAFLGVHAVVLREEVVIEDEVEVEDGIVDESIS